MVEFSTSSFLLTLGLLILAAIFWWWSTRYLSDASARWIRVTLRVIRGVVLFLLILLLVNFRIDWHTKSVVPPTIVVFADGSASEEPFAESLTDSTAQILQLLKTNDINFTLYSFADKTAPIRSTSQIRTNGPFTNLSSPLQNVEQTKKQHNIQSAIVLSDGIHNSGITPENIANALKIPVYTLFIGDSSVSPDVEIQTLDVPRIVYARDSVDATVQLKSSYIVRDTSIVLHLQTDGKELTARTIQIPPGTAQQALAFKFVAPDSGQHDISIIADTVMMEQATSNNNKSQQISVRPSKFQVLLVANEPSVESRFLIQAISGLKRFSVQTHFSSLENAGTLNEKISKSDILYEMGKLPNDVPASNNADQIKGIFYQSGAQGNSGMLKQSSDVWKEEAVAFTNPKANPLAPIFHSTMEWSELPPVWVQETSASDRQIAGEITLRGVMSNNPVLIINGNSKPRKVALFGQQLWRWDFSPPELTSATQSQPYSRMLEQLFYWLLQDSNIKRLQVQVQSGEQTNRMGMAADAQVYNTAFQPQSIARVWGEVLDSTSTVVHRGLFQQRNNSYHLEIPLQKPGEYRLRTTAFTPYDTLKSVSDPVMVRQTDIETLNRSGNPGLLASVSQLTGGTLLNQVADFPVSHFRKLPDMYRENDHQYVMRKSYWIWGLIVLLLGVDWWIRRRSGLL